MAFCIFPGHIPLAVVYNYVTRRSQKRYQSKWHHEIFKVLSEVKADCINLPAICLENKKNRIRIYLQVRFLEPFTREKSS